MKIGVVQFPGTCDDRDALKAARLFADTELLPHTTVDLNGIDAAIIPGGFSYGDYLRVGAIAKVSPIMGAIKEFAKSGGPVLGICNGFQILCEAGLLPGALLPNIERKFICCQSEIEVVNPNTAWTANCQADQILSLPIKHASGRYFVTKEMLCEMQSDQQIVLRYRNNLNGSIDRIAGVSSRAGNVVGLMPHPEHAIDSLTGGSIDGRVIFDLKHSSAYS